MPTCVLHARVVASGMYERDRDCCRAESIDARALVGEERINYDNSRGEPVS